MNYCHILPLNEHKSMTVFGVTIVDFISTYLKDNKPKQSFMFQLMGNYKLNLSLLKNKHTELGLKNIFYEENSLKLVRKIIKNRHGTTFIFHQLPNLKTRILLAFFSRMFLINYDWVVWGGDLYDTYFYYKKGSKIKFKEYLKMLVTRNINLLFMKKLRKIYAIDDDYVVFKEFYSKAKVGYARFYYPNPSIGTYHKKHNDECLKVLISHSASKNNNHFQAIDALQNYKNKKIIVFSVLSYGENQAYIDSVVKYGQKVFGDKFVPILVFMDSDEYSKFLSQIDIALFLTDRQSAIFTALSMISRGVKLVMKSNVSPFKFYAKQGVFVYDYDKLASTNDLLLIDDKILQENSKVVNHQWSSECISSLYKKLWGG